MARDDMSPAFEDEVDAPPLRPVWIIRLDIDTDPVYAWTGRGDLTIGASETTDDALNGNTYIGLCNIGTISPIKDTEKGSAAVKLSLPGVDLTQTALLEVLVNSRAWQYRQAWIWFGVLNTDLNLVIKPIRVKTGRMDQLSITGGAGDGAVNVVVESHQAYTSRASKTRFSQQKEIDPTDTSQDYIHDLANKQPGIGETSAMIGSRLRESVSDPIGATNRFAAR